ncbi:hypothetical protein ACFSTE_02690 [Aquimarina hainanensis]|uniref:Uncharacterized protein n=1 Tax=Aquimarina hainanensis TaxID=1578017 RepID=A0ABW5N2H8_9FLAO
MVKNRYSTQIKKKLIDDVKVSKFIATYSIIVFVLLEMVNYANSSFSDTLNNENLFCFLDTVYFENPVQDYQLLYFNDKFVFVEVFFEYENITSQNIAVNFETLLDFKIYKNIEPDD